MAYKYNRKNTEILITNHLDEEFQAMLRPLNIFQHAIISSRYTIRDNFITPNGTLRNYFAVTTCVLIFVLYVFRMFIDTNEKTDAQTYFEFSADIVVYTLGFSLSMLSYIFYNESNVQLLLKLHKIYKMKRKNYDYYNTFLRYNWLYVVAIVIYYLIALARNVALFWEVPLLSAIVEHICLWALLFLDGNVLYSIRIATLINHELTVWNSEIIELFEVYSENEVINELNKNRYIYVKNLQNTFMDLLDAFNLSKTVSQVTIMYHTADVLFHCLLNVHWGLLIAKQFETTTSHIIFSAFSFGVWIIKHYILQVLFSVQYEKIILSFNNTNVICTNLITLSTTEERRIYKNIHRLCRTSVTKMKACGLYIVDAGLPLRLFSLLATYMTVLLQFALT